MDFLSHSYRSQSLIQVQSEITSLINVSSPVLIMGHAGAGRTSWALALAKAKGTFEVIEASQAPKNLKDWKNLFSESKALTFVLEDIEKWSETTQNSLSLYLREVGRSSKNLVCTSMHDLAGRVDEGSFKHDLLHRLSIRTVALPRLLECCDDFESAVDFWLEVHCLILGRRKPKFTLEALEKLKAYDWVSDWTEFVSVLERAVSCSQDEIASQHISFQQFLHSNTKIEAGLTLAEMEKKLILQTLKLTAANRTQAARLLGISIRTLRNKLNEYKQGGFYELV